MIKELLEKRRLRKQEALQKRIDLAIAFGNYEVSEDGRNTLVYL